MTQEKISRPVEVEPPILIPVSRTDAEEEIVSIPELEQEIEENSNEVEDLSDLTSVTKEDVLGKEDGNSGELDVSDLTSLDDEDIEELFEVDQEDIIGAPPESEAKPPVRSQRFRRTRRSYPSPPILGGMR